MMNTGLLAFEHGVSETNFLPMQLKIQFLPEPNPEHMNLLNLSCFMMVPLSHICPQKQSYEKHIGDRMVNERFCSAVHV